MLVGVASGLSHPHTAGNSRVCSHHQELLQYQVISLYTSQPGVSARVYLNNETNDLSKKRKSKKICPNNEFSKNAFFSAKLSFEVKKKSD